MRLFVLCTLLIMSSAAMSQVILNEILYDIQGTDDPGILFTELYGTPGTSLNGWTLQGLNGNGGAYYLTLNLSGTIPDDGYFVVGGANVANVDLVLPHDLQNAGSASGESCDGVELLNSADEIVDRVCYGQCDFDDVCTGEGGTNAPDPTPSGGINRSLARIPDHSDTDDNAVDWSISEELSPGAANNGTPCVPISVTLVDIRENTLDGVPVLTDEFVEFRGIVNVDNYTLDSLGESNFCVQDDDAGCNIFRGNVPAGLMEGDCVEVSGWVGHYNGLTEITSTGEGSCTFQVEDLGTNVGLRTPVVLTGSAFFEAFEGMLVEIRNVFIVDGASWPSGPEQNVSLVISDGLGTITLRIDGDTDVWMSPPPADTFSVRGIVSQFDNIAPYHEGYQLIPRYPGDIQSPCRAISDLTAMVEEDGQFRLNFTARQTADHFVWSTVNPENDGDPDGGSDPDWVLEETLIDLPSGPQQWTMNLVSPHTPIFFVITAACD